MLGTAWSWLHAGTPPHWIWIAFALYVLDRDILPKLPTRANSILEVVFNQLNKLLLPIFQKVPALGPFLALLDTPEKPAPAAKPDNAGQIDVSQR